eukprot:m.57506 g.57506  ORF g.57506 m.57506 type:complete len:137 (+) comp7767_c1_seq1:2665-3075(+)
MATSEHEAAYAVATSVAELNVTSAVLTAAARHIGETCKEANATYIACKKASGGDPIPCMVEGAGVTTCTRNFFLAMKEQCGAEFEAQWQCLDKKNQDFSKCRKTQDTFDSCMFDKMGLSGSFQTFDTSRSDTSFRE